MTPPNRARLVKSLAAAVGFDRVGIARAAPSERVGYYKAWLAAGHAGSMEYLRRNLEIRADPSQLLPGARSIICVALSYNRAAGTVPENGSQILPQQPPCTGLRPRQTKGPSRPTTRGQVASYALGRDYHLVIRRMLNEFLEHLRLALGEPFKSRICVDTAPILERDQAQQAGLGWIGKNTCLLDRQLGSYLFLGEALTTLEIEPDAPVADHCAACTRCLNACPTKALIAPRQLDARRCVSYLTIEHRGEIPVEFLPAMGNWVYGCDICQQVCPFNAKTPAATHPEILAAHTPANPDLIDLLRMRSGDYRRLTQGSASRRATRNMWRRNAAIALGNLLDGNLWDRNLRDRFPTGQPAMGEFPTAQHITAALTEAAADDDIPLRRAAAKSLARLNVPSSGS
jgi:epoxyqueuosine reductase